MRSRRQPCRGVAPEGSALLSAAPPGDNNRSLRKAKLMAGVFIGVDPHKLSATIEVVKNQETVLSTNPCREAPKS